jgi:hypothetical protein
MPFLLLIGLASYAQVSFGTAHMMATIFLFPVVYLEARNLHAKLIAVLNWPRSTPADISLECQRQDLEAVTLQGEWIPGNFPRVSYQEPVVPMIGDVLSLPRPWIDHRVNESVVRD